MAPFFPLSEVAYNTKINYRACFYLELENEAQQVQTYKYVSFLLIYRNQQNTGGNLVPPYLFTCLSMLILSFLADDNVGTHWTSSSSSPAVAMDWGFGSRVFRGRLLIASLRGRAGGGSLVRRRKRAATSAGVQGAGAGGTPKGWRLADDDIQMLRLDIRFFFDFSHNNLPSPMWYAM